MKECRTSTWRRCTWQIRNARAECVRIVELCGLAGQPQLASVYIRDGMSAEAVEQALKATTTMPPAAAKAVPNGFDVAMLQAAALESGRFGRH